MKTSDMISRPSSFFDSPIELAINDECNKDEKLRALKNWKAMIIQLQAGEQEGMGGEGPNISDLEKINSAIRMVRNEKEE